MTCCLVSQPCNDSCLRAAGGGGGAAAAALSPSLVSPQDREGQKMRTRRLMPKMSLLQSLGSMLVYLLGTPERHLRADLSVTGAVPKIW